MQVTTWIARLTPAGTGAIATLAVRGPAAWTITRSLFRTQLPDEPLFGTFYLGRLGEDPSACDEIVVAVTPEGIELHCHGGIENVRFLQDLFIARGAVVCDWPSLPHNLTPLQALARNQLAHAPTLKTAAILLDQVNGAFENALRAIQLPATSSNLDRAACGLARLHDTRNLGRHLIHAARILIAGPPNVGKSSLINTLAGFTRSVVSPIPGTTRDVVTTRIAVDGWPVELIDTAGLHAGGDALEREGMARAHAVFAEVDLRLWLLDASVPPVWPPPGLAWHGIIINKVDLPAAWDTTLPATWEVNSRSSMNAPLSPCTRGERDGVRRDSIPRENSIAVQTPRSLSPLRSSPEYRKEGKCVQATSVSCKTGEGLLNLIPWIVALLQLDKALSPGESLAFTPELADRVAVAHDAAQNNDWQQVHTIVTETLVMPPIGLEQK